jgi:hypothetical protein
LPDELRSTFANPENQFSHCLETIAIYSSLSRVHKEAGTLLCDFGRYTSKLSNYPLTQNFQKEAHTIIQYQTRRPNQHRHSQSPDICKRYALFWQQMT